MYICTYILYKHILYIYRYKYIYLGPRLAFDFFSTKLDSTNSAKKKQITSAVRETGVSRHNGGPPLNPQFKSAVMV